MRKSVLVAMATGFAVAGWVAASQDTAPSTPFSIYVFAKGELPENQPPDGKLPFEQRELVDSAGDVRGAIEKNYQPWFRVVESREGAEIVLEITERDNSYASTYSDARLTVLKGHVKVLDSYDGPIEFTFKTGAGAGWRNMANRLVGVLHDYCSKSLASLERERSERGTWVGLRRELEALGRVEAAAPETYRDLTAKVESEEISADAAARTLEEEIVTPLTEIHQRVAEIAAASSSGLVALQLRNYVKLRQEAWALTAESIRSADDATAQLALEKHRKAKQLSDAMTKKQR